ncbi:hypothetical protein [Sulfurospirillum oryzae]|uniref:hypothetical protein n=1 Tax=Sulfurospirillum oryzae TaxID=2976535 RepID=UPI0021E72402|nr:hypothetical protein [Sulfurospirillum oryzae]
MMNASSINTILLLVVLINMFIMGSNRIITAIKAVALQGIILALLAFFSEEFTPKGTILFLIIVSIKGIIIPMLLIRATKLAEINQEMHPLIGYMPTMFIDALSVFLSFFISQKLPLLPAHQETIIVPVFFATLMSGMILIIARQKAITQVIGYLIMENGVYILSSMLTGSVTFLAEIGVLLDVLAGVFIMGIMLNHISTTFDKGDVGKLTSLRE